MPAAFLKLAAGTSLACAILAAAAGCDQSPAKNAGPVPAASAAPMATPATPPVAAATPPPHLPDFQVDAISTRQGLAAWYDVPAGSLPERRAWPEEMTAASDSLALETYARVTRLENGRSVIVRITDRGIHKPGTIIDLDRTAGEALGMIRAGQTRVKVEAPALKNVDARGPSPAPKASAQTSPPKEAGASAAQEKAHAEQKPGSDSPP